MPIYFFYYYYRKREIYRTASKGMFKLNKIIVLFSVLSWGLTSWGAIAQTTSDLDDNITFSGESLEGISTDSVDVNEDYQNRPKLDLTIETEKESSDTDVLFDGLLKGANRNESPINTIERINTNGGDRSNSTGGTIPIGSF